MAQKKVPKKRKSIKPETILVARAKSVKTAPVKVATKKAKPTRRKKLHFAKYAKIRVKKPIFYSIISIILAIAVVFTWIQVSKSVHETNATLDASRKTADTTYMIAKKEADIIKIIGTRLQRQSEIKNYQSAPANLRSFVTDDYKTFKKQCIANGQLSSDVGYEVGSVIYDSYAVVKRTCNGTDTAILKKFGDKWAIAFSGNVLPPCTLVNDLEIPQGASYYCQLNDVTYVNPNP